MTNTTVNHEDRRSVPSQTATSQCIDWYTPGDLCEIECGDVRMTVRFVGRKGRRGRIAIEASPGTVFHLPDGNNSDVTCEP